MAIPAAVLTIGKALLMKEIEETIVESITEGGREKGAIKNKKKLRISKKKSAAWVSVVVSLLYLASSQGYISPEIANLVQVLLSDPETVNAIEAVVE